MEISMPTGKQNWITFHQTKQIQSSAIKAKFSVTREDSSKNIFHPIVWNAPQRSKNYLVLALAAKVPPLKSFGTFLAFY